MDYSADITLSSITHADYIPVLRLLKDAHQESRFRDRRFDDDRAINKLNDALDDPDFNFLMKAVLGDEIIGVYIGFLSQMDFMSDLIAMEREFYVRKKSRGTRAAYMLQDAFDDWAKEKGAISIMMAAHHSENNDPAYSLCEKMGMAQVGRVYERSL